MKPSVNPLCCFAHVKLEALKVTNAGSLVDTLSTH